MARPGLSVLRLFASTSRPGVTGPSALTAQRWFSSSSPRRLPTTSTTTSSTSCPSCGAPLPPKPQPLCPSCSTIVPPPPAGAARSTYFDLFDIERPSFRLDHAALKRSFLKLQQRVHPDLFGGQGDVEGWARTWSATVNDAYKALGDDLARAEYLLALRDVEVSETDQTDDPSLLMEVMEAREALDDATTEDDVAAIRESNKEKIEETLGELQEAFEDASSDGMARAKALSIKLRYFKNIDNVCREWTPGSRGDVVH